MNTGRKLLGLLAVGSALSSGCSTMSDTTKGAGIGGAIGTGAGLALGAATGNPRTGAVVGGLLGAGVGAAAGKASDDDKQERREVQQAVASATYAQAQAQLGMIDVVRLTQQQQSPDVIINQIHATGSTFKLATADLEYLKQNGVADSVIITMQNAQPRPVVVAPRRVYPEPQTVIIERPGYYYGPPRGYGYYRHW